MSLLFSRAKRVIVTGGCGFIGSAVVRFLINNTEFEVLNIDKLTYAASSSSLLDAANSRRYHFRQIDICDRTELDKIFLAFEPDLILHLAAESHVDRSIDGPADFISTNILGTYNLLEAARSYFQSAPNEDRQSFRFHHISTDEVYGDLASDDELFREDTPYSPNSPYSASKASSDHLVRAWYRTYDLPIVVSNCSNNYGPFQFPEKLIPHMVLNACTGKPMPVYGNGKQVRDWLHVDDHVDALMAVALEAEIGKTYNIGGNSERQNIQVVHSICDILEELRPQKPEGVARYMDLIQYVDDRPGHDIRYAIDATKIRNELRWAPSQDFESGLRKTIHWYLDNEWWWQKILEKQYELTRLGT